MNYFKWLLIFILPINLFAQIFHTPPELAPYIEYAPEIISKAAVLIDAQTGALLYSKNPDLEIPPASLAKLMTMHLVMKAVEEGRASLDELVPITAESWAQNQPRRSSLMFLEPGQTVTLREIMLGLAVSSGNDAAVAAALRLAPSVSIFSAMMTQEARNMGLHTTRFVDASGISHLNRTTAAEFTLFCRNYLNMHPYSLEDFHSVLTFAYPLAANVQGRRQLNPRTITQNNGNILLRTFPGVDGLKTGYIGASGYNIALTAQRDQTRFILVLLGAPSERGGSRIRAADSTRLLEWAFDNFKTVYFTIDNKEKEELLTAPLWKGKENNIKLKLAGHLTFTSHVNRADKIKYEVVLPELLIAPILEGTSAGYLYITDEQGELSRIPLVTAESGEKGNIFKRLWHSVLLLFKK
ncbi:MAG: D-alanyl-D-alanine carboxypeptidase [Treponema sp.]|nr:D-alanyl-D-alanine carboxypeptidase [Treponema sp.]